MTITERASKIKLLLMDVDGVWTDCKLHYTVGPDGQVVETKAFNAVDGMGLRWMSWLGFAQRRHQRPRLPGHRVSRQAARCEVHLPGPSREDSRSSRRSWPRRSIGLDEICFMGDDLTDAIVMRRVGLGVAVANARPEVKAIAHMVTQAAGGEGAVREVIEVLLKAQGKWQGVLEKYEVA